MKLIKFTTYLFYRYYSTGPTASVAYMKAITAMIFLIFLNVAVILILSNAGDLLLSLDGNKAERYLKVGICLLPFYILFFVFLSEKKLRDLHYNEKKIKLGKKLLLFYVIFSVLFFPAVLFLKSGL